MYIIGKSYYAISPVNYMISSSIGSYTILNLSFNIITSVKNIFE